MIKPNTLVDRSSYFYYISISLSVTGLLTIVNGQVRRALLRTSCHSSDQYFEKKVARATSKKFRRVTSVTGLSLCTCKIENVGSTVKTISITDYN